QPHRRTERALRTRVSEPALSATLAGNAVAPLLVWRAVSGERVPRDSCVKVWSRGGACMPFLGDAAGTRVLVVSVVRGPGKHVNGVLVFAKPWPAGRTVVPFSRWRRFRREP